MTNKPLSDDIFAHGLTAHIESVRSGNLTVLATVEHCLERLKKLDPRLNAFEHVATEQALHLATKMDKSIRRGNKAGTLLGVPIGVKDIFSVDNMPTTNGSHHPHQHLNGAQGPVIRDLEAAGCIVLGKTRTVEFALGATGLNSARGTPVNVWDSTAARIPGGSSSGSAVAVASGICGFALGSDTGGSIRNPACLNGLVGHKTTVGLWSTKGIFPLSSTLDSAGPLCRRVADAALIHTVVTGEAVAPPPALNTLRFGRPQNYFFEDLDDAVKQSFELALEQLKQAGVTIVDIDMTEAYEREHLFPRIVPPELIAQLTVAGFNEARADMDPVTEMRAAFGLEVTAAEYIQAQQRLSELREIAEKKIEQLDGWLTPTCPFTAMTISSVLDGSLADRAMMASRNTMPVNIFGLSAVTLPISHVVPNDNVASVVNRLPTGLQIVTAAHDDARLLSMALSVEQLLGPGDKPDLTGFC